MRARAWQLPAAEALMINASHLTLYVCSSLPTGRCVMSMSFAIKKQIKTTCCALLKIQQTSLVAGVFPLLVDAKVLRVLLVSINKIHSEIKSYSALTDMLRCRGKCC